MAIAKRLNLIVIATRALVLPTNDLPTSAGSLLKRFAITVNGDIFTALTFVQHA